MTSNLDIYRSAKLLIDQHGDGAIAEAERRAQSLTAQGEWEGAGVWKRIRAAIQELQRTAPPAGRAVH